MNDNGERKSNLQGHIKVLKEDADVGNKRASAIVLKNEAGRNCEAAYELAKIGVVEAALSALNNQNHALKFEGAAILANVCSEQWEQPKWNVQTYVAKWCSKFLVPNLLNGPDATTAEQCARALWNMTWKCQESVKLLVEKCNNPNFFEYLVELLSRPHHHSMYIQLLGLLMSMITYDPDRDKKKMAYHMLVKGVPPLMNLLKHASQFPADSAESAKDVQYMCLELVVQTSLFNCMVKQRHPLSDYQHLEVFASFLQSEHILLVGKAAEVLLNAVLPSNCRQSQLCRAYQEAFAKTNNGNGLATVVGLLKGPITGDRRHLLCDLSQPGVTETYERVLLLAMSACFHNLPLQLEFANLGLLEVLLHLLTHQQLKYSAALVLVSLISSVQMPTPEHYRRECELRKMPFKEQEYLARYHSKREQQHMLRQKVQPLLATEHALVAIFGLLVQVADPSKPSKPEMVVMRKNMALLMITLVCGPSYPTVQKLVASSGRLRQLLDMLAVGNDSTFTMYSHAISSVMAQPYVHDDLSLGPHQAPDLQSHAQTVLSVATEADIQMLLSLMLKSDGREEQMLAVSSALSTVVVPQKHILQALVAPDNLKATIKSVQALQGVFNAQKQKQQQQRQAQQHQQRQR
mmetsp:Transcript_46871/g.92253  ORF Transcript_46871/g.92253 Transcript_46871/m.92253 type:complete len:633 (-) Transcript_46871:205-2103(-)